MQEGWIGSELDMTAFVPTRRMSFAFDCVLVLVTLVYLAVYALNGMTWLIACACLCLVMLSVSLVYVHKGPDMRYINVNIVEIIFFMVTNVVFLGTAYGFQLYVFGFIAASMLLSLSAGGHGKVLLPTKIIIALMVTFYTVVTIWFGSNTPLYSFSSPAMVGAIFMLNSLTTMGTIVLFTGVYMATSAALADRLTAVALHDALTGLLNRHGFYPIVAEAYGHAAGRPGLCHLAMLDIDFFKDINDTHGHDAGDAVLKQLANLFRSYMERWPGLQVSRWGGEEFLLLYATQTPIDIAKSGPFEAIRAEVESAVAEHEGVEMHWTVTVGVADCAEGNTADGVISLSDKRLYEGKQSGRNRVVYGPQASMGDEIKVSRDSVC